MEAEINTGQLKGLTYRPGTKETDPAAIGRIVIEFDADEADAAELAALMQQGITVTLSSPQLQLMKVDRATGEIVG